MISTIIVDDSSICVDMLFDICSTFEDLKLNKFTKPEEAVIYSRNNLVNLAFLDVSMPGIDGIELGQILRTHNPDIVLIYVSSKEETCSDAMRIKADGYIFKPYSIADISYAINKASLLINNTHESIYIKTRGNFDIYCGNELIHFSNAKAKELLALCVASKGQDLNMETAIKKLWPGKPLDDKAKRLYRKAVSAIKSTLSLYTNIQVFANSRGNCRVLINNFKSDYLMYSEDGENMDNNIHNTIYFKQYNWSKK